MARTPVVLDIETTGDPWSGGLLCVGWSYALPGDEVHVEQEPGDTLRFLLADPEVDKVCQSDYDLRWLRLAGYDVAGSLLNTQVQAWMLDENTNLDLESLVELYLGRSMDKRLSRKENRVRFKCDDGKYVDIADAPYDQVSAYNARDVADTRDLFLELRDLLSLAGRTDEWLSTSVPFSDLLLEMETTGVPINLDDAGDMRTLLNGEAEALHRKLMKEAGLPPAFNINSGDQLADYLYKRRFSLKGRISKDEELPTNFTVEKEGRLWISGAWSLKGRGLTPHGKTPSGKRPAVDNKILTVHHGDDPWVSDLLEYAKLSKVVSTYLDAFPRFTHDDRLYGTFRQTGTVTGRLSSADPNLQNIPSRGELGSQVRALFQGDLMVADFGQLEPRLMAHFSQDPVLLDVYREGRDIYTTTGAGIFGCAADDVTKEQRGICKLLVLAMGYGAQSKKLAELLSVGGYFTTSDTAQGYLDELSALYRVFFEWKELVVRYAYAYGRVETIAGRERYLARSLASRDWKTASMGERQAVNSIIQGSAADIVQATMLGIRRDDTLADLRQLIQVHDEVVMEAVDVLRYEGRDQALKAVQYHGETGHGYKLAIPLVFEPKWCHDWSEK